MQFIYPRSSLSPRQPDEQFQSESAALSDAGHTIALIDIEKLATHSDALKLPTLGKDCLYRGWMLTPAEYQNFIRSVENAGGKPLTAPAQYPNTHYLPNWYGLISDMTPETVVLPLNSDWVLALRLLVQAGERS